MVGSSLIPQVCVLSGECGYDMGAVSSQIVVVQSWSVGLYPEPASLVQVTLGLLNPLSGSNWVAPEITSAAKLAVQYINMDTSILPDVHLNILMRDSACDVNTGLEAASHLIEAGAHAIIGAGCSAVCEYGSYA